MRFSGAVDLAAKCTASFFFVGYLPLIPGTFGSIAGVVLFCLLRAAQPAQYFLFLLAVIALGLLAGGRVEKALNKKDPGCVVIDEVAGMLLALSFAPYDIKIIFLGFLFFRILDTLKPFPAIRVQNLHGSIGIMGDDLVAGAYTWIILQTILGTFPKVTV